MLQTKETLAVFGVILQMYLVIGNPVIFPEKNPVRVLAPGTITLTCKVDGETDIKWEKSDSLISAGGKYNISIVKKGNGGGMESTSILNVLNPTASDQGLYVCYGDSSPDDKTVKIVNVLEVVTTDANLTVGAKAVLGCEPQSLTPEESKNVLFRWTINDEDVTETNKRAISHKDNYTLEITDLIPEDAGLYKCEFQFVDQQSQMITTLVQPVNLFAAPIVNSFEKSKNMVQGDTLKLKCRVFGHPMPVVVWKRDNVDINAEADERISIKDLEENNKLISKDGLLTIFDLQFEDRAMYKCEANNTYGSSNSTIIVRVKDKLAALWPFLGIVAEVAILCTIIFIYEKKRSKDTEDEEDAPLQKTPNAQDHKGKDEVRQRKP